MRTSISITTRVRVVSADLARAIYCRSVHHTRLDSRFGTADGCGLHHPRIAAAGKGCDQVQYLQLATYYLLPLLTVYYLPLIAHYSIYTLLPTGYGSLPATYDTCYSLVTSH